MAKTAKDPKAETPKGGKARAKPSKDEPGLTGAAAMAEARRRHGFGSAAAGAVQRTIFVDVLEYSPTLPSGRVTGDSVADHAEGHPYLTLTVSGAGDLGLPGREELERIYFIFADAVAGRVETARRKGRYEIHAGVPAVHFAAAHHMVQSEKPLKVRVRLSQSAGSVTFEEADLYAPGQRVGQRED